MITLWSLDYIGEAAGDEINSDEVQVVRAQQRRIGAAQRYPSAAGLDPTIAPVTNVSAQLRFRRKTRCTTGGLYDSC